MKHFHVSLTVNAIIRPSSRTHVHVHAVGGGGGIPCRTGVIQHPQRSANQKKAGFQEEELKRLIPERT